MIPKPMPMVPDYYTPPGGGGNLPFNPFSGPPPPHAVDVLPPREFSKLFEAPEKPDYTRALIPQEIRERMEVRIKLVPMKVLGVEVGHLMAEFKVGENDYRRVGFFPKNYRSGLALFRSKDAALVTPDPIWVKFGRDKKSGLDISQEIASFQLSSEEAMQLKGLLENSAGSFEGTKYVYQMNGQYYRAVTLPFIGSPKTNPSANDEVYNCATWLEKTIFKNRFECGAFGIPNSCEGDKDLDDDEVDEL